ncbi:MAG: GTPase RsgA, partial [Betaproteobacteria bacterium]|nr:GTPase RsgA [Betaproteobacteria bacterium]
NALVPDANAATREISTFLASGKHTTTYARLYRLAATSAIIDCPGMREFGLAHLDWRNLAAGFREFRPYTERCRFPDCRHRNEPGCAVANASATDRIAPRRLELYRRISAAEYG